jgi:hypothetical protein
MFANSSFLERLCYNLPIDLTFWRGPLARDGFPIKEDCHAFQERSMSKLNGVRVISCKASVVFHIDAKM